MSPLLRTDRTWTDRKVESVIGNVLRTGISLAAAVVFCGGVIFLAHTGEARSDYQVFQGEPDSLKSVGPILHNAFQWHGRGIIQLGLLLLIATPVARVGFSVFGFAAQRDRMYVAFTLVVLTILLYSLFGASFIA